MLLLLLNIFIGIKMDKLDLKIRKFINARSDSRPYGTIKSRPRTSHRTLFSPEGQETDDLMEEITIA